MAKVSVHGGATHEGQVHGPSYAEIIRAEREGRRDAPEVEQVDEPTEAGQPADEERMEHGVVIPPPNDEAGEPEQSEPEAKPSGRRSGSRARSTGE